MQSIQYQDDDHDGGAGDYMPIMAGPGSGSVLRSAPETHKPLPIVIPEEVPFYNPFTEFDPVLVREQKAKMDRQTRLLMFSDAAPESRRLRAEYTGNVAPDFRDPPNSGSQNSGGILNSLMNTFGNTQRFGRPDLVDGGNGDSKNAVIEQTLSHLTKDMWEKIGDVVIFHLHFDPNMYTGPNGLMPYKRTKAHNIEWDTFHYLPAMIDPVPELAPSRILGFTKTKNSRGFTRYALGLRNTTDYFKSQEGQLMMGRQLTHMAITIQEFNCWGVLYALNEANDVHKQMVQKLCTSYGDTYGDALLKDDIFRWNIMGVKDGIFKMNARVNERLIQYGGRADCWVVSEDMAMEFAFSETQLSAADVGLQNALMARSDSMLAMKRLNIGEDVIIARAFAVGLNQTLHPLESFASIGEHYFMTNVVDGRSLLGFGVGPCCTDDYRHATTIEIYDENNDSWGRILQSSAIQDCEVFVDATNDMITPNVTVGNPRVAANLPRLHKEMKITLYKSMGTNMKLPTSLFDNAGKFFTHMGPMLAAAIDTNAARASFFADSIQLILRRFSEQRSGELPWEILSQEMSFYMKSDAGKIPTVYKYTGVAPSSATAPTVTEIGEKIANAVRSKVPGYAGTANTIQSRVTKDASTEAAEITSFVTIYNIDDITKIKPVGTKTPAESRHDAIIALGNSVKRTKDDSYQLTVANAISTAFNTAEVNTSAPATAKNAVKRIIFTSGSAKTNPTLLETAKNTGTILLTEYGNLKASATTPIVAFPALLSTETDSDAALASFYSGYERELLGAHAIFKQFPSGGTAPKDGIGKMEYPLKELVDFVEAYLAYKRNQIEVEGALQAAEALQGVIEEVDQTNTPNPAATVIPVHTKQYEAVSGKPDLTPGAGWAVDTEGGPLKKLLDYITGGSIPSLSGASYRGSLDAGNLNWTRIVWGSTDPEVREVGNYFSGIQLNGQNDISKFMLHLYAGIPFDQAHLLALDAAGAALVVGFQIVRAHATYSTETAFKVLRGSETGNTWVHDGIFSMGEDANIQEVGGSFSFKAKAVVTNPKNVYGVRNARVSGRIGGMGLIPIRLPLRGSTDRYDPMTHRYGRGHTPSRTKRGRTYEPKRPSYYVFMQPYSWINKQGGAPQLLSLHGRLFASYSGSGVSVELTNMPDVSTPMTAYYRRIWDFDAKVLPNMDPYQTSAKVLNQYVPVNATTYRGFTRHWDPNSGEWGSENYTDSGTGHWGSVTRLGDQKYREGTLTKERDFQRRCA